MGKFTDDQPLPAMPANGIPGIMSALDNDGGANIQSQAWGDRAYAKSESTNSQMPDDDMPGFYDNDGD